ncbi:MAG: tyrosine-type recombinase/integrase [Limnochordia bacterium]
MSRSTARNKGRNFFIRAPPFLSISAYFNQILQRKTPRVGRHTFSTLLHRAGVDMDTRQKLLGHSDVATTMHYTHPDVETLRRGIAQINILRAK